MIIHPELRGELARGHIAERRRIADGVRRQQRLQSARPQATSLEQLVVRTAIDVHARDQPARVVRPDTEPHLAPAS